MNTFDYLLKYICIGDISIGKSCLVLRYAEGKYKEIYEPTIGVEFASKNLDINVKNKNLIIKTQVWDTAGQESFKSITRNYYRGAIGALLIYDISQKQSFQNLNTWYQDLIAISNNKIEIVIVGNKSDVSENERQVSYKEGENYANSIGKQFFECSAKTGENVQQIFNYISKKIVEKIEKNEINPLDASLGIKIGKRSQFANTTFKDNDNLFGGKKLRKQSSSNDSFKKNSCYC